MAEGKLWHALFVAAYLVVLLVVGARKASKIRTLEDFSLAGRGLSSFVLVATLLATWIGVTAVFDNAGETYRHGVNAFLLPIGGGLGILFLYAIAARLRRFGGLTIQDILEARFGPATRILGTLTLVGAYLLIVSYQYRAGAAVLGYMVPDLAGATAMDLVALFVIAYTALAGMYSVAHTDVASGIVMALGLFIAIPVLLSQTGGFSAALESLPPGSQEFTHGTAALLGLLLPALLLLLGDANMVQRFFSAESPHVARRSVIWMFGAVVVLELAIILVALLASALVAQGAIPPPENPRHILIHVAFEALPTWLGALLITTVVAIVVSTADSYLLAPATALVRDVYQRFLRPNLREDKYVFISRLTVVVTGLTALGLALSDRFFSVARFAYTIYGAGITPVLLAAYFWPRATPRAAVVSMTSGVGMALIWRWLTSTATQDALHASGWTSLADFSQWATRSEIQAVLPAFLVSALLLVVVSLLGDPPDEERAHAFERAASGGSDAPTQEPSAAGGTSST